MRETNTHIYFWSTYLSQWAKSEFTTHEGHFENAEKYMMFKKAQLFGDDDIQRKILNESDPQKIKSFGRHVKNFDEELWSKYRYHFVRQGNLHKFSQNPDILEKLIDSGDKIIVEGSPYDKIWGVGLHFNDDLILDERNWRGLNLLGEAIMEVRKIFSFRG